MDIIQENAVLDAMIEMLKEKCNRDLESIARILEYLTGKMNHIWNGN